MITQDLGIATAYGYAKSKGYTGTEAEFAELMASYASVAQSAAASATAAAGSATSAASSASTASAAATTATTKASEASTSATNAAGSASSAASSATAASGSATSAAASATTASGKASEATTAATTATTAKTDAVTAKTAAETAQTAAETAQGKAEDAQAAAEDAAESVSASAAQIATNTSDISDLKSDLTQCLPVVGIGSLLASGEATSGNATYSKTIIVGGLSLKANTMYAVTASIASALTMPVYMTVSDSNNQTIPSGSFMIPTGETSVTGNICCDIDYTDAYLSFQVGVKNLTVSASISTNYNDTIANVVRKKVDDIADSGAYTFDVNDFGIGSLSSGTPQNSIKYRVATYRTLTCTKDLHLTIASGYKFGVHTYYDNAWHDSGWKTTKYTITAGSLFRIVIAKSTEDTSITADIATFVNALKINSYLLDMVSRTIPVADNFSVIGNPFKSKPYFSHIGVSQTDNIIIPNQSIADVARAKRLGFDVIELNVRITADSKYVCIHGNAGAFGYQFIDKDGNSVTNVMVNSMTLQEIKETIRFRSKYPKYRTAPFTFQEMLYECKKQGIIPLVEYQQSYTDEIEILNSIMGKNNYILSVYTTDRGSITNAPLASWLTISDPTALVQKCKSSGGIYFAGINASDSTYNSFTDNDWKNLAEAVHEAGYLISFVSAYTGEAKSQKLFSAGFDASGSGWGINEIENGNLCNLFAGADFSDFTTDGTITDGTLTLENGDTITPSAQLDSVFLGGGSLHITYNGTITLSFGNYINDSFTSDGTTDMWFSTYFEEAVPTFEITATANTEVYDLTYKASNM